MTGWSINEPRSRTGRRSALERRDGCSGVAVGPIGVERGVAGGARTSNCRRLAAVRRGRAVSRRFARDLARLAAWRAVPGQPATFQPQGMVTGKVRFDQQADRVTAELTATGEQLSLRAACRTYRVIKRFGKNRKSMSAARRPTNRPPIGSPSEQFQVQSATLAVMADGQIDRLSTTADVNANGAINYDLAQITPLLKAVYRRGHSARGPRHGAIPGDGKSGKRGGVQPLVADVASTLRCAMAVGERVRPADWTGQAGCDVGAGAGARRSVGDRGGGGPTDDGAASATRSGAEELTIAARTRAHECPHLARR